MAKQLRSEVNVLAAQSCPTLGDPMDYTPPSSSVHGILQAKNWSGLPFPSPGDPPDPGIEPRFPALQADSLPSEPPGKLHKDLYQSKAAILQYNLKKKKQPEENDCDDSNDYDL